MILECNGDLTTELSSAEASLKESKRVLDVLQIDQKRCQTLVSWVLLSRNESTIRTLRVIKRKAQHADLFNLTGGCVSVEPSLIKTQLLVSPTSDSKQKSVIFKGHLHEKDARHAHC